MDQRAPTLLTFIDFKKAFDCVQHDILAHKVDTLSLGQNIVDWLKDYLRNRKQQVMAKNCISASLDVKQGIPQGSIIGPIMYIIYTNDISNIIKHSRVTLYADDTVLYSKSKNLVTANKNMQKDLNALENWCLENKIFINTMKTKFMLFGSKPTLAKAKELDVKLTVNGQPIARVHNYCYLGVYLDEPLNYESHARLTINRVKLKIIQLKRMRSFLNKKAAILIYKNMILPIMEHGDIFLASLSVATKKKLQIMQNKALRTALGMDQDHCTTALHKEAKLLKLDTRQKAHMLQLPLS